MIKTPHFNEFMASKSNKANLQHFLCTSWEKLESYLSNKTSIYRPLWRIFRRDEKYMCITSTREVGVAQLVRQWTLVPLGSFWWRLEIECLHGFKSCGRINHEQKTDLLQCCPTVLKAGCCT